MRTLTVLCNTALLGFTGFVLATEGAPKDAPYVVFTLLLTLIPILTVSAIVRGGAGNGWPRLPMKRNALEAQPKTGSFSSGRTALEPVAAICNIVLLGFVCWALVDQYPHPEEEGVVAFAVLTVLTPVLSAAVLWRAGPSNGRRGPHRRRSAAGIEGD